VRNALSRPAPAPPFDSREPAGARSYQTAPPDTWLFFAVAALVGIGLVMIYSASSATAYAEHHDVAFYAKRQGMWLVAGLAAAFVAYRLDYHPLKRFAPYILVGSIITLALVLVPHVGFIVNGARRWIGASSISFQPSEFAKLALVVYLGTTLAQRGERITSLVTGLFPLCVPVLIMGVLVLKEPDLGTASLLGMIAFAMFFVAGARIAHLLAIAVATLPPVLVAVLASPYQRERVFIFLNPWRDPENMGFHIVQSLLALGSGGIFGVGLGASRAKFFYLPEQYTDFIFSVIGEELGLIGALAVVVLFVLFTYRAVKIAIAAPDRFGFFLAIGCTAMITIQAFINIGVVTSSWPVTGVPLPFISFGGSSLIVNLVAVALIMNVGRHRRVGEL
jgi:cell division protein FtsW